MRYFTLLFLLVFQISCFGKVDPSLPPPYNEVEILPYKMHGWFSQANKESLHLFMQKHQFTTVVELGSWLGASSIFIAQRLPAGGKLYCVDHWKGSVEHHRPHRTDVAPLLPTLYQQFLSNIIHQKLTDCVIPLKMTTLEAADFLKVKAGLIYVDASHDTKSVYQDLVHWYPKLQRGGILCGDDWSWNTVRAAVVQFAKEKNLPVHNDRCFWWFEPKK